MGALALVPADRLHTRTQRADSRHDKAENIGSASTIARDWRRKDLLATVSGP